MAVANVKLTGPASWHGRGHKFKRGQTKFVTSPGEIAYFMRSPQFEVKLIEDTPKRARRVAVEETEELPEQAEKEAAAKEKPKLAKKTAAKSKSKTSRKG